MAVDAGRAKSIFLNASDLADSFERAAYLDRECGLNAELRGRVEALLRANDQSPIKLPATAAETVDSSEGASPSAPTIGHTPEAGGSQFSTTAAYQTIAQQNFLIAGRYTLQEKIGEGGMGEVWVAKQSEPVKRKVALKLIKQGMDSRAVLQRFELERQALAMMDHPNIAKVLDAGLTPIGQPFFVMELVNGLPLNKFCDELKLTPKERLELFVPICQAVQHAHQKGIVHRDLKPANILITMVDARPTPKIIDFGVAKATAGKLTDESMSTQFGAVLGTLEYMSPEQAGFSSEDIDTRADIYSLGVILYELLTGLRPIDSKRLKKAALTEMIRIIREEEPSKPSTRLSTDASLPSLAALRQTDPRKLMTMLRGELDWVVMKCLEKHRERRYETANALARDVQRYLANEAVEARPPSAGYRFQKFIIRNKGQVIAASLLFLTLLGGIVGTSIGMLQARKAWKAESERATGQRLAKLDADWKRREAETNLGYAKKGNEILGSVFQNLDPRRNYARVADLTDALKANLTKAVQELEGSAIGDPLAVAEMQDTLGVSLLSLGAAEQSIPLLIKARDTRQALLGPESRETLASMNQLAVAYHLTAKSDLALPLYEKTLELTREKLGAEHPDTLVSMNNLASGYLAAGRMEKALPMLQEAVKLSKATLGARHPDTLTSMNNLAGAYRAAGKLDLARSLYEETLMLTRAALGPEHPDTLGSMNNLAGAYQLTGKLELALPLYEEAVKRLKAKLGDEHPTTLTSRNNLASAYRDAGKLDLAVPLFVETVKLQRAILGPDHPDTLQGAHGLATTYLAAGRLDLALPLLEETVKLGKAKSGPVDINTLDSMISLAQAYESAGRLDAALPLSVEINDLTKAKFGPDHPRTLKSLGNLAFTYWSANQFDKSIPLFEEALMRHETKYGRDHARYANDRGEPWRKLQRRRPVGGGHYAS